MAKRFSAREQPSDRIPPKRRMVVNTKQKRKADAAPNVLTSEDIRREATANQLYTTKEAAQFLRVNVQTLANWRAGQGTVDIPFIKIGKSVRYRHRDLVQFIESRSFTYTAEAENDRHR